MCCSSCEHVNGAEEAFVLIAGANGQAQVAAQRIGRSEGARDDARVEQAVGGSLGRVVIADRTSRKFVVLGADRQPRAARPSQEPFALGG